MTMETSQSFTWNKDEWTPLSEMADGFDEYRPPLSDALVGQRIELSCVLVGVDNSEHTLTHEFTEGELTWSVTNDEGVRSGRTEYEAFEMQPGLFFLHYRRPEADHPVVVTAAFDLSTGQVTGAVGELGLGSEPHLARQSWFQGQVVDSTASRADAHPHTDELIGRRVRYAYSGDDVYDHVYLNGQLFTWFCASGAEAGFGDTDRCV
ncbi:MAG: MoaF N-terminal domain-containing protein, partial [Marmoricola sp.]